ncbi:MAG: hypothetical protein WCB67_00180 [Solirubrobacteraceae bacterium]
MATDAVNPALSERGDVDHTGGRGAQLVQGRCGVMTEHGLRPAGQDGGQPATVEGQSSVADCVHPSVDAVEVAAGGEPGDGLAREPERPELQGGDEAVLSPGEDSDLPTCGI